MKVPNRAMLRLPELNPEVWKVATNLPSASWAGIPSVPE